MFAKPRPDATPSLTVAEVAEQLAVGPAAVLGWIASGELPAVNVSRSRSAKRPRWRITRAALDVFLLARTQTPAPSRSRRRTRPPADVIEFYK